MKNQQIFLASRSPRRRTLIEQLGLGYQILDVEVDERHRDGESPADYVARLALEKARRGWQQVAAQGVPVVGADTCIVLNGRIVGKPVDKAHGIALLKQYSGATHQVFSAVAMVGTAAKTLQSAPQEQVRVNTSRVTFRQLTERECERYWETQEPLDKAGGYAIQGKAAGFIKNIEGSYSGIMGLPLYEFAELMSAFSIQWLNA
ncbi:MAG: nucleoside triphosphate pyrophosphatase [Gammaproteobacteria bacterium]|jgi:septum formation protein